MEQIKGYEIRLPLLQDFPKFFELAETPRLMVGELIKVSVFKDGVLVGDAILLDVTVEIATAISEALNPK